MLEPKLLYRISQLSPERRHAFVAGCAERVYDAYTHASHPPSSKFAEGLELLWASIGQQPAHADALGAIAAFFDERIVLAERRAGEEGLQSSAMSCLLSALRTVLSADANQAVAASQYLSGTAARSNRRSHEAVVEEDRFQRQWLDWCGENDPQLARPEFCVRNEARPVWVERMEVGGD